MSTTRDKIQATIDSLGLAVRSEFVPWAESRNATRHERSLNWRVSVVCRGQHVLTTDYGAGIGHCPSYRQNDRSSVQQALIDIECHHGARAVWREGRGRAEVKIPREPILPDVCDVLASLVRDGEAINFPTFESWANDLGYDTDSRSAEATYRVCLEIGLAMRAALGERGFSQLSEACRDL